MARNTENATFEKIFGPNWQMQFSVLCQTKAFERRNKEWPFESWDYTEWEECIEEAKKEKRNGSVG